MAYSVLRDLFILSMQASASLHTHFSSYIASISTGVPYYRSNCRIDVIFIE